MSPKHAEGLRERKKRQTREAVRCAAFRLFEQLGYPNTTVEQIAAAAEISPRTFFRYFPTKAALLIPDQLTAPVIELFLKAPAELSPIARPCLATGVPHRHGADPRRGSSAPC